ncbi:zinc finger BED domain-containing protein RICESLEEPER 2-like [Impatiens glandulifera]|uniref:zinc finger BED domain-containing protein RICESLEEPER 2-like n=1 Tax=Impatiens glandulifera TaxID=253017 RepID=UPI001FB12E3D|nr:zinc finger BED domain-containing protein RICESLEEPER 2-like [Impatiens glandulifera]
MAWTKDNIRSGEHRPLSTDSRFDCRLAIVETSENFYFLAGDFASSLNSQVLLLHIRLIRLPHRKPLLGRSIVKTHPVNASFLVLLIFYTGPTPQSIIQGTIRILSNRLVESPPGEEAWLICIPGLAKESMSVTNNMSNDASGSTNSMTQRKKMKPRSDVWMHYERFVNDDGNEMARCMHCKKVYNAQSRNGTTTLKQHLNSCPENPLKGKGTPPAWKFDQDGARKSLARMIIIDELPFSFVDGEGFRQFMSYTCPKFLIPSRWTVARDCYDLYIIEKLKLMTYFKNNDQRVSITTDTWTSNQKVNYLCITGHFIDIDWMLKKRILCFCPISSHSGESIGKTVEKCLIDWGIDRIFTVTVDNASSNDTAVAYLKKTFTNWGTNILEGKLMHMRCIAHIVNLIVTDGLKEVDDSISRIRGAVRYVRQSPSRLAKFKQFAELEKVQSKRWLCLDVSTRWNSTYLMLDTAQKFERVFDRYKREDATLFFDLDNGAGMPNVDDWTYSRAFCFMLKHFYELTLRVSGSAYVTCNSFLNEISTVHCILQDCEMSDDCHIRDMAKRMKMKYDKYWGDIEKMNKLIFISAIIDPRQKMDYVDFVLKEMYGEVIGVRMSIQVKQAIYELYNGYKDALNSSNDTSERGQVSELVSTSTPMKDTMTMRYKRHKMETGSEETKSELDKFLNEDTEKDVDGFHVLGWWKINYHRFPILSQMARDVLAVPISTVASESAFSTGGRVLNVYRSSLTPRIVQSLICAQDWLRASPSLEDIAEEIDNMEKLDNDLSELLIDSTIMEM